jgi:SAM-dependent methyltransferase
MSTLQPCRSCGSDDVEEFYAVRGVPMHSCLVMRDRDEARGYPTGDILLTFCRRCAFIQNDAFEPARVDYGAGYEDSQAYSPRWVSWASDLVADLADRHGLRGGRALEIGCGKGDFLALLASVADMEGVGYDPAYRPGPLVPPVAGRLSFHRRPFTATTPVDGADLVCCRHVLEHVAEPAAFLSTVRSAIGDAPDTVVLFEVPGSERILDELAFWDIYYEHCSYFTEPSLRSLFERSGFHVTSLVSAFDGQYLLLEARPALEPMVPARGPEEIDRVDRSVARFTRKVPACITQHREDMSAPLATSRGTVLWGAGSKAVGCLTTLGLGDEVIAVVDIDPAKQGGFLAGTGHAVVAPDELERIRPDRVLITNPTYATEIEADLTSLGLAPTVATL